MASPDRDRVEQVVEELSRRLGLPADLQQAVRVLLHQWDGGAPPMYVPGVGDDDGNAESTWVQEGDEISLVREPAEPPALDSVLLDAPVRVMNVQPSPAPAPSRSSAPVGSEPDLLGDFDMSLPSMPTREDPTESTISGLTDERTESASWGDRTDGSVRTDEITGTSYTRRFVDLGPIGSGGMGEVRRVLDRDFHRLLALKMMRPELTQRRRVLSRFVAEAQVTAQLQHPGIVPVHDMGRLPDGRRFFTMREIRGRHLGTLIAELHAARIPGEWRTTPSGWTFRKLIDVFHKVCETIAYAHSRGVIHRDLKPDNVMVGDFGEVLVVDWGLAKVVGRPAEAGEDPEGEIVTQRSVESSRDTVVGSVAGTPAYMPIEQATGDKGRHGPQSDVYSLGAVLYEILGGRPPYGGRDASEILGRVIAGPPEPPDEAPEVPDALRAICAKAMARQPEQRYPSAIELANEVARWLEGAMRREQALKLLDQARERYAVIQRLQTRAEALRREAERALAAVRPTDPVDVKRPGWDQLDEARRLDHGAEVLEAAVTQLASASLAQDPDLPEAHALLADHYHRLHSIAESRGATASAERFRVMLQAHDRGGRYRRYLDGGGALTLVTDPPGAEVQLFRYVERTRRLVAEPFGEPLRTPLRKHEVPMGSYLLVISAPGRAPVRYPVHLQRNEHWDGRPPGASEPLPIHLPAQEELRPGEIYVPAGWFRNGEGTHRVWLDGFVIERDPVTVRKYLAFLNDLSRSWRERDAIRHAPAEHPFGGLDRPLVVLGRSGVHELNAGVPDAALDWPVTFVSWADACAYASWRRNEDEKTWWLPRELEWEKAARGVDGRAFPWGGFLDPTWCCMAESHHEHARPAPVDRFGDDASPYGVMNTAGNAREWCADPFVMSGPLVKGGRPATLRGAALAATRAVRGGSFDSRADECRTTFRVPHIEEDRLVDVGFRLVRPLPESDASRG